MVELTNEGSGRENFSTSSTGVSPPSLIMSSRRESTVFWIWGRIASICSRVKIGSIMPLQVEGESGSDPEPVACKLRMSFTFDACAVVHPCRQRSAYSSLRPFHPHSALENQDEYAPIQRKRKNHRVSNLDHRQQAPPTLDKRSSVNTLQTSLCLTTSHALLPSHNSTLETGSEARSLAYSTGGSAAARRAKGNLGGLEAGVGKIGANY